MVEQFINPDNLKSYEQFAKEFKTNSANKKLLESKFKRKKLIRKLKEEIEAINMLNNFKANSKIPIHDEDFDNLKDFMIKEIIKHQEPKDKLYYIELIIKPFILYLCAMAGFGLFSYRLNILYAPFEVFIYGAVIVLALYMIEYIKKLSFIPSNAKTPILFLILALMILNIYFHVFEFSYIWLFYILFVTLVYDLLQYLLNRFLRR